MGTGIKDSKNLICPKDQSHLVYPVFISPSLSYNFCRECKDEVGTASNFIKLGKFTLLDGSNYSNLDLFSDLYPLTSMLIGKSGSGKTEVIKTLLQKSINDGIDKSKIFIFDSNNSYSDWVKENKGLVISSPTMLKSVIRQNKILNQYDIFCFTEKALARNDDVPSLISEIESFCLSPKHGLIKKTLVMDSYDSLIGPHPEFEDFIHNCLGNTIAGSIAVVLASHTVLTDEICQSIGNVFLFEQVYNSYPQELKIFFDLDPFKLPKADTLGVYLTGSTINYTKFIHISSQFTKNYQYFNSVKHIKY